MFKHLLTLSVTGLFVLVTTLSIAQNNTPYRSGVLQVKFKETSAQRIQNSSTGRKLGIPEIDNALNDVKGISVKRIFRESQKFEKAHREFGLHLWYEIRFDESTPLNEALKKFRGLSHFEIVEPSWAYEQIKPIPSKTTDIPTQQNLTDPTNDPLFSHQWHYKNTGQTGGTAGADISLPQAWTIQTGNPQVVVAVIDGGIDLNHPDLAASMWTNTDEIANNLIDDDHNGYVDDIHGYGFGDNSSTIYPHFHGTHVAGTIAAVTNNSIGVAGIAGGNGSGNGVRLMTLAGFGNFGVGGFEDAMVYAADNGAVISQNSWRGGSTSIEAAIDYFVARAGYDNSDENFEDMIQTGPMAGGIVIFAAGNESSDYGYPAMYPPVVAVASTDHNDQKSYFSNFGSWVDIAAPGSEVYSTYPVDLGSYATLSGTSMACPHVSGVASLIISEFGGMTFQPSQVWDRLRYLSDDIDDVNPSYIGLLGSGRLNAYGSLQTEDEIPPATITDLSVSHLKFNSVTLTWTAPGSSNMEGAASYYDIRYSLSPINESNFSSATGAGQTPQPQIAGSVETFEVQGLSPNTNYYIAIKARDFFGNNSFLSNIVSVTTLQPPVINVSPTSLSENLFTGDTSTKLLTIRNDGASELTISVSTTSSSQSGSSFDGLTLKASTPEIQLLIENRKKNYKAPQKIIPQQKPIAGKAMEARSVNLNNTPASAGRFFATNYQYSSLQELNPGDGSVIRSMASPEPTSYWAEGLAFDGEYLYYTSSSYTKSIYRISPETGEVVSSLLIGDGIYIDGLAHSGKYLYAVDYELQLIYEINYDLGEIVRVIDPSVPADSFMVGLSFGGSRGTLFVSGYGRGIYEIDLNGEIVNSFPKVDYVGLGYSEGLGILFAVSYSSNQVDALNPDTGEVLYSFFTYSYSLAADEAGINWLDVSNDVTTIASGESVDIPVHFDATGLTGGIYQGEITITSNDPATPNFEVPVSLHVTGAPNLDINTEAINFGDRYLGIAYDTIVNISNTGTDILVINSIESSNSVFSITDQEFPLNIEAGETAEINLQFAPGSLGDFSGIITITSNDPSQSIIQIDISGSAVEPPLIQINPESFEFSLYTGETATETLAIQNIGGASLNFAITLEASAETGSVKTNELSKPKEIISSNNTGEEIKSLINLSWGPLAEGDFTALASSPVALTCIASDPSGVLYAQQNEGYSFYKYDPATNTWSTLASCPLNSSNNGGAAFLNGKIYTSYTNISNQLGVYDVTSNTWSTITNGISEGTGNIESDGSYLYLAYSNLFAKYNPQTNQWTNLATPTISFDRWGGLSHLNGTLYGHSGNGSSYFAKYDIGSNTWTTLPSLPSGGVLGSAIDPVSKTYFTYGSYGGNNLYAYSIEDNTWSVVPIPFFNVYDGGLVYNQANGPKGIFFVEGEAGLGFGKYETQEGPVSWLAASPLNATVLKNSEMSVEVGVDATGLQGGTYNGNLKVSSNDPLHQIINVPVVLHVTGAPDIVADSVHFVDAFVNHKSDTSLLILNNGTDDLIVTSINTSAPFSVIFTPFTLAPGETQAIAISFQPVSLGLFSGSLTVISNDPDEPEKVINLSGKGVNAPVIGVNPASLSATLFTGEQQTKNLTISNTGGSVLNWTASVGDSGSSSLEDILYNLNDGKTNITSLIPSRYNFYGGESGSSIDDGGNDMYDGGNFLSTNFGNLSYTQGVVSPNSILGSGGKYFTMKYEGLFVLAADIYTADFFIDGNLGADGSGNTDAAILQMAYNGKNFKGFIKRVYNAGDPSVNHLIIVEDNGLVGHETTTNTNSDYHRINSLSGVNRIYYLLFAGNSGAYINNESMQTIMNQFLVTANSGVSWLTVGKTSGQLQPGQSETVAVTYDASGMDAGQYGSHIIVSSNDPENSSVSIPANLTVTGASDIALSVSTLDFGNVYAGITGTQYITVTNTGSDQLNVNLIESSNSVFTVSPSSFILSPKASTIVAVMFTPAVAGIKSGTITVRSNDPNESAVPVSVAGKGIIPARAELVPGSINVTVLSGERRNVSVKIKNTGGEWMYWNLYSGLPSWITVNQYSGALAPGSEGTIQFSLDSKGMSTSTYSHTAYIEYNHPSNPYLSVPVQMVVSTNHSPTVLKGISDQILDGQQNEVSFNLAKNFYDEDGQVLQYSVNNSDESVTEVTLIGSVLTVAAKQLGVAEVTIFADDGIGQPAEINFNVRVDVATGIEDPLTGTIGNYPNPFSKQTTIEYTLTREGDVNLTVYDAIGSAVVLLVNDRQYAGQQQILFDGTELQAGFYYFRLRINNETIKTVKMIKR